MGSPALPPATQPGAAALAALVALLGTCEPRVVAREAKLIRQQARLARLIERVHDREMDVLQARLLLTHFRSRLG